MAQRLIRAGLMRRDGACGLVLSESGERQALKAIRKRRIFEAFLVAKMGYTWDEVYAIASKSSNHLDDDLVERMFEQAGSPHSCPHGDPIPTHDGKLRARAEQSLPQAADCTQGVVSRVASHDSHLLRYLGSLNLKPGAEIQILSRAPFGGPIRLRVARGSFHDEHVIGSELAEKIFIA
jgi:DtxR family Mn-dependent transcriptional regulator